jgi:hypothetical protein
MLIASADMPDVLAFWVWVALSDMQQYTRWQLDAVFVPERLVDVRCKPPIENKALVVI